MKLTDREKEIYLLVCKNGKSYKEIAKKLVISYTTLKTHLHNIFQKKRVSSQAELIFDYYNKRRKNELHSQHE